MAPVCKKRSIWDLYRPSYCVYVPPTGRCFLAGGFYRSGRVACTRRSWRTRRFRAGGRISASLHPILKCIYRGKDNISCMALTADSTIAELLREKPESAQVLFRFGMGCLGCAIANNETIREAAQAHGIPLEEMLSALGVAEA